MSLSWIIWYWFIKPTNDLYSSVDVWSMLCVGTRWYSSASVWLHLGPLIVFFFGKCTSSCTIHNSGSLRISFVGLRNWHCTWTKCIWCPWTYFWRYLVIGIKSVIGSQSIRASLSFDCIDIESNVIDLEITLNQYLVSQTRIDLESKWW